MNRHCLRATTAAMTAVAAIVVRAGSGAGSGDDLHAPARLSDTGLYVSGQIGTVDSRNRQFSPQYPLWSDGAVKIRWVFLPPGTTIDARNDAAWELPVGTRFWKEFSFGGRKVETRMLWRASVARWVAVSYIWNDEQTDAVLAPDAGEPGIVSLTANRRHSIPSVSDCLTCHGTKRTEPLGFNPLQLSPDRDANAIHGEPLPAGAMTLRTLVEEGLLSPARTDLVASPPRIRSTSERTRTMLGYLAANCGSCHKGDSEMAPQVPSMRYSTVMHDGDGAALSLVKRPTQWQVPGAAENASVLIDPDSPELGAILARMKSRSPSTQMPPLGTVLRDQAAVDALTAWTAGELAVLVRSSTLAARR